MRLAGSNSAERARASVFTLSQVDDAEAGPVLRNYLRQNPVTRAFFDAKAADPVEMFIAEAPRHPVFRLISPVARG